MTSYDTDLLVVGGGPGGLATALHARARGLSVIVAEPRENPIDIRDLDFMGSCAYAVLAQESVRCRRRGVNMRLVSNQPIVARTIAACGLRRLIPLYATVETALAPPPSAH